MEGLELAGDVVAVMVPAPGGSLGGEALEGVAGGKGGRCSAEEGGEEQEEREQPGHGREVAPAGGGVTDKEGETGFLYEVGILPLQVLGYLAGDLTAETLRAGAGKPFSLSHILNYWCGLFFLSCKYRKFLR